MTVAVDIHTECDQIMTDANSNETGTGSLSTITTPTLSYYPLSEESFSDRNTTPGYPTTGVDFRLSPDLLTKNLLTTPRNRLSYQGDVRNKSLSNDRRSFQEMKLKNMQDNCQFESFSNKKMEEKIKSDNSIINESFNLPKKESMYKIIMDNNYELLSHKNSILHQEDSSYEEVMPSCKTSVDSLENFEPDKSIENIHYETLIVTSPESCNSSQREMSISPQVKN